MKLVYGSKKIKKGENIFYVDNDDLYIPSEQNAFEKTNPILIEIENKKINGEKVSHLFKYSDISMWWFFHPTIAPLVKEAINFIDKFQEIINKKQPTKIHIAGEFTKLSLIRQICNKYKIELQYSKFRYFKFLIIRWIIWLIQPYRFRNITIKKTKMRVSLFKSKYENIPAVQDKIIFAAPNVYRRYFYDSNKGQILSDEYILGPISDYIKKMNFDLVGIDMDYTFKGDPVAISKRLEDQIPWVPIEIIQEKYSPSSDGRIFINSYLKTINNEEFKSFFNYSGINFWEQIEYDFKTLSYFPYLPTYIKLIESLEKFFNSNKPHAVVIPYETGPLSLPIIIACKRNGIRTIGLQHGIISRFNADYSHKDFRSENNPLGMPLPDFLLLFGNFAKKILLERGTYPPEKLTVFGHSMYFDIDNLVRNFELQDLKKKYEIPQNKKIILFGTGRYQSYYKGYDRQNYDEKIFTKLLEEFANKDQFYVILKPHPSEKPVEFYKNLISKYNCKNFVIMQGDVFELLYISDIVVSSFSTLLIDAIVFGKMAIQVIFGETKFPVPFDEYEVLVTSDLASLSENINKLLFDIDLQNEIKKNRTVFIKEQFNIPNPTAFEQLKSLL